MADHEASPQDAEPPPIRFDNYCEAHGIKPGEEPAAFAAYLHHITGGAWDGDVEGPIDES